MEDVIKKLKLKGTGTVLNAPAEIEKALVKHGFKTALDKKTLNTDTVVFIKDVKSFVGFLSKELKYIEPDSVLWFAYPKGTSGIKTDINRDILRETAEEHGVTTVTAVAIDDTWSALRLRPIDKVGKK
jgi:hypothetical protein